MRRPELEITTPAPRSAVDCDGDSPPSSSFEGAAEDTDGRESEAESTVGVVGVATSGALAGAVPLAESEGPVEDPEVPGSSPGCDGAGAVSAQTTPGAVATAAPIPNATAIPPTRAKYTAEFAITHPDAIFAKNLLVAGIVNIRPRRRRVTECAHMKLSASQCNEVTS